MNSIRNNFFKIFIASIVLGQSFPMVANPAEYIYARISSMVRHPFITGSLALGSFGAYCAYVRSRGALQADKRNSTVKKTKKITSYLTDRSGILPQGYKYWKLKQWEKPYTIYDNWQKVYEDFKIAKPKIQEESTFIKSLIKTLQDEKAALTEFSDDLKDRLKECTLIPQLKADLAEHEASHPMFDLIAKATHRYEIFELNAREFEKLNTAIRKLSSVPIWNPYKILRDYALPFESDVIQQYWKLLQLSARLDALEYCLEQRLKEIQSLGAIAY